MPNTKSAIRRSKKTKLQAVVNKIRKSKYKSAIKQMSTYIDSGKIDEAKKFLPKFHSQLMKVAKTGVVSKKTVSRKISRLTKKISKSKKK
jgi:small subunit ribosomal protein S20